MSFGSIPSFFLELFLHWSPIAYWAPTNLGSSSFSVLCLFILFIGFSRQEYWSGLPFPFPVDHILSDLSTMPARLGWPHTAWLSFIELDKAVFHVIRLASCLWLWFQCVCPLIPSLSAYHLTWVSLTLDMGSLFTAAPAKHSRFSLPLLWGSSSRPPPLPSGQGSSSWPPSQPTLSKQLSNMLFSIVNFMLYITSSWLIYFITEKLYLWLSSAICPTPTSHLWLPPVYSLDLWACFVFKIPHISEIRLYLSFSVWLSSLNITPSITPLA